MLLNLTRILNSYKVIIFNLIEIKNKLSFSDYILNK